MRRKDSIKKFFSKQKILAFMAVVMLQASLLPNLGVIAFAAELQEVSPIENLSILEQAVVFDESINRYVLDEELLREVGFNEFEIEEFKVAVEDVNNINSNARGYDWIADKYGKKALTLPAWILTAVSFLQYKVADTIISNLINWCLEGVSTGYKKFCNKYGNSNWATKAVCVLN